MRTNNLALFGFGLILVSMTMASGNYLYATLSDIVFLAAYLGYRRQRRTISK